MAYIAEARSVSVVAAAALKRAIGHGLRHFRYRATHEVSAYARRPQAAPESTEMERGRAMRGGEGHGRSSTNDPHGTMPSVEWIGRRLSST